LIGACALALACTGMSAAAADATLSVVASQDTSIYFGTPDAATRADGTGDFLWLSVTAEGLGRRMLLKFDVSAIPAGSTVKEVTLTLYESMSRDNHDVSVHRLLAAWGEGASNAGGAGIGAQAQVGDATWLHRFYPSTFWTNPGGDFDPVASAVRLVDLPNTFYSWAAVLPSGSGAAPRLVQDVQAWVNAPLSNHGWLLIGQETGSQNAKRFQSRNNATAQVRPRLTVVYAAPAPVAGDADVPLPLWATAMLAAALAGFLVRRSAHR
jgi:hypothetical protein